MKCIPNSWQWYLFTLDSQGMWRTMRRKERKVGRCWQNYEVHLVQLKKVQCWAVEFSWYWFLSMNKISTSLLYTRSSFLCKWWVPTVLFNPKHMRRGFTLSFNVWGITKSCSKTRLVNNNLKYVLECFMLHMHTHRGQSESWHHWMYKG